MDFVHDALADGRQFRVLTVVDQWSRQRPILEAASSMSGRTVGAALDRALVAGQAPRSITVDHGIEFMSRALEDWADQPACSWISFGQESPFLDLFAFWTAPGSADRWSGLGRASPS